MLATEATALRALRRAVARVTSGQAIDAPDDIERLALALFRALVPVVAQARREARIAAREAVKAEAAVIAGEHGKRLPSWDDLDNVTELDRARAAARSYAVAWAKSAAERLAQEKAQALAA
jgi:hypothetical protein